MKQIIEKVMKNLCHDGTMLTSKTHPSPPLKKEGTKLYTLAPCGRGKNCLMSECEFSNSGEGLNKLDCFTDVRNDKSRHAELVSASRSVILSGAKNLKSAPSLATSHKRYSIVCSAESRGEGKGFTLAEVLITLGIIGVVAALTLPTLIQNYQKQVWVNQLKKSVSVWENGMKMMLADADTDDLLNTEFWQNFDGSYGCGYAEDYSVADNILKKYFKILKFGDLKLDEDEGCAVGVLDDGTKYKALDGTSNGTVDPDTRKIYMADGTLYGLWAHHYFIGNGNVGEVIIDVNGENKGPNQWGRDSFAFYILPNGNLIPYNSYEYLKKHSDDCGDLETGDISNANGYSCSARIIAEGWKMNY